jgi:Uma2 family endonuclease
MAMATVTYARQRRPAVLHDIDWETYTHLLRVFARSRRLRLTYDRGTLVIKSPQFEHERLGAMLGRFVEALTEESRLPCRAGGSLTLRRKTKLRGLEPDRCYWVGNAPRLFGKRRFDIRSDPPPDIAIEVDVTRSSLNRMNIYASLKVPEVWRLTDAGLAFHVLQGESYPERSHSLTFPQVSSAQLTKFLSQLGMIDDNALVAQVRKWARKLKA